MATRTASADKTETVEDIERELADQEAAIVAADEQLEHLTSEKDRLERATYDLQLMASDGEKDVKRSEDTARLREIVSEIEEQERARRAASVRKSQARSRLTTAKAERVATALRDRALESLDDVSAKENYATAVAVLRELKAEAASFSEQMTAASEHLDASRAVELRMRQTQISTHIEMAQMTVLEAEIRLKRHERAIALATVGDAREKAERLRPKMEEAVAAYEAAASIASNIERADRQLAMDIQIAERNLGRLRARQANPAA